MDDLLRARLDCDGSVIAPTRCFAWMLVQILVNSDVDDLERGIGFYQDALVCG